MPKVELVGAIAFLQGWDKVADLVQESMKEWGGGLEDWTVRIRLLKEKEIKDMGAEGPDLDVKNERDEKEKILTVAFGPAPALRPRVKAELIMENFVDLGRKGKPS